MKQTYNVIIIAEEPPRMHKCLQRSEYLRARRSQMSDSIDRTGIQSELTLYSKRTCE